MVLQCTEQSPVSAGPSGNRQLCGFLHTHHRLCLPQNQHLKSGTGLDPELLGQPRAVPCPVCSSGLTALNSCRWQRGRAHRQVRAKEPKPGQGRVPFLLPPWCHCPVPGSACPGERWDPPRSGSFASFPFHCHLLHFSAQQKFLPSPPILCFH